jgi:CRISPR-associated protein Csb2
VPLEDQLRLLDDAHQRFQQVEARVLPIDDQGSWYRLVTGEGDADLPVPSAFSGDETEWIVYEVVAPVAGGRRLLLDSTLTQQVARATRGTVLLSLGREASARLSGHDPDGRPTQLPHLAFVPLADVGHPHATGSILGVALVPPRDLPVGDRDALLESLFRAEQSASDGADARRIRVTLGRRGVADLRRLREPSHLRALLPSRWTRPARRWVSATAVALGRNPGNLRSRDTSVINRATEAAERSVAEACENIGLPAPSAVWTHRRSLLEGAPAAHRFMPFPDQGSGPRRVCVHAEVVFDRPVQGPVILGAGRFFGLGLCVPQGDNR